MINQQLLTWHLACYQFLRLSLKLFLYYLIVSIMFVFMRWEAMPGKFSCLQVYHYIGKTFKIVSSTLLFKQVWIQTWKANSAHKVCLFSFRNVTACLRVNVEVTQTKVQQEYLLLREAMYFVLLFFSKTFLQDSIVCQLFDWLEDKVFRLHVSMNDSAIMNLFKAWKLYYFC